MLLAIDIGNTNVVLGLFRDQEIMATWRLGTDIRRTSDEFVALMLTLLEHQGLDRSAIDAAIISSVVPPLTGPVAEACRQCFGVTPLSIEHNTRTGIEVRVDNPREVGADRIVNSAAARVAHGTDGSPLIVIDFGTATTFDAVSGDGAYLGGAIAPGIGLSSEALFQHAAKLPRIELEFPEAVVGKNTVHAMQAGIMFGYLALVEGIVARMKHELGGEARVVATGGLADVVGRRTDLVDVVEPDLTLQGLRLIHELNQDTSVGAH
jgi:type III pantothenate kinase